MKDLYYINPLPPLTQEQLELLEQGFPVKPNYDPNFYPDSQTDPEIIDRIINTYNTKKKYIDEGRWPE